MPKRKNDRATPIPDVAGLVEELRRYIADSVISEYYDEGVALTNRVASTIESLCRERFNAELEVSKWALELSEVVFGYHVFERGKILDAIEAMRRERAELVEGFKAAKRRLLTEFSDYVESDAQEIGDYTANVLAIRKALALIGEGKE